MPRPSKTKKIIIGANKVTKDEIITFFEGEPTGRNDTKMSDEICEKYAEIISSLIPFDGLVYSQVGHQLRVESYLELKTQYKRAIDNANQLFLYLETLFKHPGHNRDELKRLYADLKNAKKILAPEKSGPDDPWFVPCLIICDIYVEEMTRRGIIRDGRKRNSKVIPFIKKVLDRIGFTQIGNNTIKNILEQDKPMQSKKTNEQKCTR